MGGGKGPVSGNPGGFTGVGEQGGVRHDELDLHRGGLLGGLAGEALDEGVAEDLPGGAVTGLALGHGGGGLVRDGPVAGGCLESGQQRGEVGHPVLGGFDVHMPGGHGLLVLLRGGFGVFPVGRGLGLMREVADAQTGQPVRQRRVDVPAGLPGQPVGVPLHGGRVLLADLARLEGAERVRQVLDEVEGLPEVGAAPLLVLSAGQGDLGSQPATTAGGRDAAGGLVQMPVLVECCRLAGLCSGAGGLEILQGADAVDGLGLTSHGGQFLRGGPEAACVPAGGGGGVRGRG